MARKQAKSAEQLVPPFDAKDEMNLAEFPISLLSDRPPGDARSIVFEDTTYDSGSHKTVARKLTITGSSQHGLPRGIDEDVIVALIQLTKLKNEFTSRKVQFTRNELITLLGWPYNGKSYQRLEDALNRWVSVTLHYENAWWDKSEQAWASEKFHILDNYGERDSRARNRRPDNPRSEIYWNEIVFNSFASGNLRDLDYRLYLRLDLATSKRMLRFLGKRLYRKSEMALDLEDFALAHVGLSRGYASNSGKIKEKLRPAIQELTEAGFLEPMSDEERFVKQDLGWKVVFRKAGSPRPGPAGEGLPPPIIQDLIDRGVTPSSARQLAEDYPIGSIQAKLEVHDWLIAKKDRRVNKSPDGYLVKSIQCDYKEPKGFKGKAQVEAERRAAEQANREAKAVRETARQRDARLKAEDQAIKAHLAGLDAARRAELEAEALGDHPGTVLPSLARLLVRDHVGKLLGFPER